MELIEDCAAFDPRCRDWILWGDFNQTPEGDAVTALRERGFEYAHASRPHLRTAVANGQAKMIDYVFHTAWLRPRPLESPPLADDARLPSVDQPSDHLALIAEFDCAQSCEVVHDRIAVGHVKFAHRLAPRRSRTMPIG